MRAILQRLGYLLVSLSLCLVLAELLGRQSLSYVARNSVSALGGSLEADPELLVEYTPRGRRLVPHADVVIHNHYVSGLDVDIKTNSLGLRDIERAPRPPEKGERIIVLGDSIVIQDYLPHEKTLTRMLERSLNSTPEKRVEVINGGISNFGLEEEYQLLTDVIDRLHPTVVLLSFYLNDSRPPWGFSGEIGPNRGWLRKHSIVVEGIISQLEMRKWLKESHVERFGWIELIDQLPWKSDRDAFLKLVHAAPYDWGSAWDEESWVGVERGVVKMKELVERSGARFGAVIMPVKYQVESDFVEDQPQRKAEEIFAKLGVPSLSLLPVERKHRSEEIFYDWCHPNERGNQIIAGAIGEFVSRELLAKEVSE